MRTLLLLLATFGLVTPTLTGCSDSEADAGDVGTVDAADVGADAAVDGSAAPDLDGDLSDAGADGGSGASPVWVDPDAMLDAIDVFIGSGGLGFGYASLTPAVQVPWGFVKLGPDTTRAGSHVSQQHFSGFNDADPDVRGFSHIRLVGTGATDLGLLRVTPLETLDGLNPDRLWRTRHLDSEAAAPGWYEVEVGEPRTRVELTTSGWVGVHRYTFDAGDGAILFDATASIEEEGAEDSLVVVTPDGFEGWLRHRGGFAGRARAYTVYFSATVSRAAAEAWAFDTELRPGERTEARGTRTGAVLEFEPGQAVELRIGVSLVDAASARSNREALAEQSIDAIAAANREAWRSIMEPVRVSGGSDDVREIFFTALYNAHRMPTRLDEPDGRYRGVDGEIHAVDSGRRYFTDLSLWDTFRTLHPWYAFAYPELQVDCMWSLLRMYEQGGHVPQWPAMLGDTGSMIGASANMLFAQGQAIGLEGIDYAAAFEALWDSDYGGLTDPTQRSRDQVADYVDVGWIPAEHGESVSLTLEYAWADDALFRMATALGDDRAAVLDERARSFERVFDPAQGFFAPRARDGAFEEIGRPDAVWMGQGQYTEGSPWHWRFYALQRPERLAELLGGAEALGTELETYFAESTIGPEGPVSNAFPNGFYWHGNEVALHSSALFDVAARPGRRWYWMRQIQSRLYGTGSDGLAGNDDGGALSTWYVWTAIGLYPVAGTDRYFMGAPLFDAVEVTTSRGTFRMRAPGLSADATSPRGATLGGVAVGAAGVVHADLTAGALVFE